MSVKITAAQAGDGVPTMPVPPIDGDEDAQTIYRLENECYNLRMAMAKTRKATQAWFFLETKLKNATDELDAAKEDRDLMLGGGEMSFGMEVDAVSNVNHTCSSSGAAAKTEAQIKREQIEQDLQRIEEQLDGHAKFSPEWFKLKEELVELRIKLDEGDTKDKHNNNHNRSIEGDINITSKKKQNKENEDFNETMSDIEVQVELPPQFHFRPISPPQSPTSPSTSSSLSRSRIIVQPFPGKPLTNNYYDLNSDDQDSMEQRALLRSQHAAACEELDKSLQFSQEWFAAKVKAVQLEEKLDELENKSSSCGGSNMSFTGWSENEEEIEAVSCADELECAMVAEALKQGCCISPSFVGDEDLQGDDGGLCVGQEEEDTMELEIVLSAEDQPEDNPSAWLEPKFSQSLFNTGDKLQLHTTDNQCVEDEPVQQKDGDSIDGADPALDDCSSMLGNVDNDHLEIKNYHAAIIQKHWSIHSKCRPFKRMKSRAVRYHAAKLQEKKGKGFSLVGFIKNILPQDKYSRWQTFAIVSIQNCWRRYLKRKKFLAIVSSITIVQALTRCKQQRVLFCKQREMATIIQCMARKHRAVVARKRLGNNEVTSILNESERVLEVLQSLEAVSLQPFWRGRLVQLQHMAEVNHMLEESSYILTQLTKLRSAVIIQRCWRLNRGQMRNNEMKSLPPKSRKSGNRSLKSPKKPPTLKELGIECLRLSTRLSELPKFSPEWTLVNVELKLVTEEMEYSYAQSLENEKL